MSHILIALAVVLAFVFNFLALQDRDNTTLVAIANSDMEAGDRVSSGDIRFTPIPADFEGVDSLVDEEGWSQVEGWILTRAVSAGSVIDLASLNAGSGEGNLRSMSLPVPVEHAAGGLLVAGDVVDVIAVDDGAASFVASGISVVRVAPTDSGGIGAFGQYHVVVAVTSEQALNLAAAIDGGSIEIVRATGAREVNG